MFKGKTKRGVEVGRLQGVGEANGKVWWALVAQNAGAFIFSTEDRGKSFSLNKEIPHPEGKELTHNMGSDQPGRAFDSGKSGGQRHAMEPKTTMQEHMTDSFSTHLADVLNNSRVKKEFDRLILVAEPKFLGKLRSKLDNETSAAVHKEFAKDLAKLTQPQMLKKITELMEE